MIRAESILMLFGDIFKYHIITLFPPFSFPLTPWRCTTCQGSLPWCGTERRLEPSTYGLLWWRPWPPSAEQVRGGERVNTQAANCSKNSILMCTGNIWPFEDPVKTAQMFYVIRQRDVHLATVDLRDPGRWGTEATWMSDGTSTSAFYGTWPGVILVCQRGCNFTLIHTVFTGREGKCKICLREKWNAIQFVS